MEVFGSEPAPVRRGLRRVFGVWIWVGLETPTPPQSLIQGFSWASPGLLLGLWDSPTPHSPPWSEEHSNLTGQTTFGRGRSGKVGIPWTSQKGLRQKVAFCWGESSLNSNLILANWPPK